MSTLETAPPDTRTPLHKLERLGRYRIVRPLSKGGMALVYEARREGLAGVSARVAIKLILPDFASSDTFQELFINEARLGASMHHQNLVQIQDFERDGEAFFIVMEYVEGVTLRRIISLCEKNDVTIPAVVIAEIGRQACEGLHYAHTAKDERGNHLSLVHRDVKPSNVIMNPQGVVKILDFGISKGALVREKKGAVKGTWGYMAPEQAMGHEVGPPADVFGLGTVLYELASRKALFDKKKPGEIKRLLLDDHAARMAATLDPSYGALVNVFVRALQRDPAARFGSAADFGRALGAVLPDPVTARDEVVRFFTVVNALNEGLPVPSAQLSTHANTAHTNATQGSMSASVATEEGISPWIAVAGVASLMVLGLGLVGVGALVQLGPSLGLFGSSGQPVAAVAPVEPIAPSAADEPPGPAGVDAPGETPPPAAQRAARPAEELRPPPSSTVPRREEPKSVATEPAPDEAVKIVVVRRAEPDPADVAPAEPEVAVVAAPVPKPTASGPGTLTIGSIQEAEVYVDGQFIRKVPLVRREFAAGRHVVTIVALDGRRKSFDVDLEAGEEVRRVWDFDAAQWKK